MTRVKKTCTFYQAYDETYPEVRDAFNAYSMKYILQQQKKQPSIKKVSAIGIIFSTINLFKHLPFFLNLETVRANLAFPGHLLHCKL
jgi:hypothetical protein